MSVYEKVTIILPGQVITIDPEMTLNHYKEKIKNQILNDELIELTTEEGVTIFLKYAKGVQFTIMSEKQFKKIQREQAYAHAQQQRGGGGIIQ